MSLPELAIRRHVTTLMLLVSMVVLGTVALGRLPLAFLPDMEEPELFVRVPYPSAAPEQVERMITRPLEDVLGSVKGLRSMWSRCGDEGAMVRLELDWSTDMHLARVEVWEKIDRIRRDLPEDIGDITVATDYHSEEADEPIMEGRLSSELDLSENYDLLDRRIVRPLQRVPGVSQVRLDGVNPREVRINLRLADLELHHMDVREVARVLRTSNFDQSLGEITEDDTRYSLRTLGCFAKVEDIRNLVVRSDGLRLKNVADVVYQEPPLEFGRRLDGHFAVGITVSAEAKANSVEVCEALVTRIEKMNEDPELQGVKFLVRFNEGEEIKRTLTSLLFTGIFGAALASIVLFVFLRRMSTTLISVVCIPFSLLVTCGILWAEGSTLNTLTLLGLIVGIGMLVDNAVVVIENIFRHQELGHDQKTAARLGSREVSVAVIAATLTSVIVFLPVIFNKPSEMNIRLEAIGVTVCLTLLSSLFISQTLIPLATSWFIKSKKRPRERWMVWLEDRYTRLLELNLRHRWLTPVIGIVIAASAVLPFRNVDLNFDSGRSELSASIDYRFSESKSLHQQEVVVKQVEAVIAPYREEFQTRHVYSYWSDRHAGTRIYLKEGMATEENLQRVRARLREILPEVAGVRLEVNEHRGSWRRDSGKRISFQIVGEDASVLSDLAEEARRRLERIDGLIQPYVYNDDRQQELHVALDRNLVARYDVSTAELASTIGLTFRGERLPRFRTEDGEREMRLTLDEQETESVSQLHNLPTWTSEGERLPLASIAEFHSIPSARRIEREDRLTSMRVGAKYKTGTREQYIPLVTAALEEIDFPEGYSWTFGSWQARQKERSLEFLVNLLLALLLVFAVMSSLFESVQQATALMIALPFALSGAIWTLYLTGTDFDQPAAVGVLLLIGIVVNNGIVMIEHVNNYQRQGMSRHDALLRGGRERLRPILMTAVTTLIGLVPIVVERPSLGEMNYYSMALVIMGGLGVATFLTLVLLPTTTTLVEDFVAFVPRLLRARSR